MEFNLKKELAINKTSAQDQLITILLVEDNPGDVLIVKELLKSSGINYSLKNVHTIKETLLLCNEQQFDVLLLDLGLPDSIGLETLKKIQMSKMISPVVVMTGLDDEDIALESLREGAQDYIVKNKLSSGDIVRGIKYGIERKKIQDLLKKNTRQFSLLSSTTAAINECEDISSIYAVICRNISMLLEKTGVITIKLDNPAEIHISGIEYFEPWYDQVKIITGLNLHKTVLQIYDLKKEILNIFDNGKLFKLTLEDLICSKEIPDINIYGIGFLRNDSTYGGALILTQSIIGADDGNIIETIGSQVSLCLLRRVIEKDLRSSEKQYQKLNKELEMKVKERTWDLKTSNDQLNQELIEHQRTEEALKKSEIRLKELNATKDKFFNIIAHDLKNPFTCLLGSTEILSANIHNMDLEKIMKLVQILNDSAKSGYAILQNLLDWARSQTGQIIFNLEKLNLRDRINENIHDQQLSSSKKEINIFSEVPEEMFICADKNMLDAVLRNLLSNAIKFTHNFGSVTVKAELNSNEVIISVKDTGIGIPKASINKLFRIDTKYTRPGTDREQGTGLGLKISKEFIEMHGGKIWVKSVVNKGSEFIFSIPAKDNS